MSQPNVGSMWGFSSCHRKRALFASLFLLLVSIPAWAATASGFVTKVDSTTAFDMGSLHVLLDSRTLCSTATSSTPKVQYSLTSDRFFYSRPSLSKNSVLCSTLKLAIGSRIYVMGKQGINHRFLAKQLIAYRYADALGKKFQGAAILEEEPKLLYKADGWNGTLWVDGYPETITSHTKMLAVPKNTNFRYTRHWRMFYLYATNPYTTNLYTMHPKFNKNGTLVFSSNLLRENNYAAYHFVYMQDGNLSAEALRLWPNHVDDKEKRFFNTFKTRIVDPDYKKHIPGGIHFKGDLFGRSGQTLTVLPYKTVQDWVSNLGMELVPQYQKNLQDTDATKVHFHFYVVSPFGNSFNQYLEFFDGVEFKNHDGDALIAMPNGMILIPDNVLDKLRNKSQLVANLEYAISSVLQKQLYRQWVSGFLYLPTFYSVVSYRREQGLRIGIRQMYLAGYDIREAPFAWAVAQGKPVNNPVIDSKHPDKEIPWYAAYAFNYISHYYQDVDYSKLKRGEKEYQAFLKELYKADPSLPHPNAAAVTSAAATK